MGTNVKAWADSSRKLTDSDKTIQADEKQVEALFTKLGEIDRLTTTAGFESAGFTANKIREVGCTQPAPVRFATLKGLDQPTRVADVIVTRVAGLAMNAHQIVIKTS
jgi:hypothetical protein